MILVKGSLFKQNTALDGLVDFPMMEFVGLSADVTLGGGGWDNVNSQIGVALPIYFLTVIVDVLYIIYLLPLILPH